MISRSLYRKTRASVAALAVLTVMICAPASAETTCVIDTPTVGMLDYGTYDLGFRLFSDGGVLTRFHFGVFRKVNLGFGWEVQHLLGSGNAVVSPPSLYLKIRPFSGGMVLPALAFGYDGQGFFYDRDRGEYGQREKGIFVVLGREMFLPGLDLNVGANIADFKNNTVCGFASATYDIEGAFVLMAEYDNVNYFPDSRLNAGIRLYLSDYVELDLAGRDIGASGRSAERIARIRYLGRF